MVEDKKYRRNELMCMTALQIATGVKNKKAKWRRRWLISSHVVAPLPIATGPGAPA